jgi:excisionase family DNA binding protein
MNSRSKSGQSASETLEGHGSSRAQWIGNPQGPRLMTIKQACQYSGLTDWCMRSLIWTGRLPFVRFGDKKVWVERRDLDLLIDGAKETFGQ